MTITLINLYNEMTGQAWSMFDGDVESAEEFEKSVTTSIQKALGNLWLSYKFPFRYKTNLLKTKTGKSNYPTPNGNIVTKNINNKKVYMVKLDSKFLSYNQDLEIAQKTTGKPESFYIDAAKDEIVLYPTPNAIYNVEVDYWTIFPAVSKQHFPKATLEKEDDQINVPEKYERLFLNALLPLAMMYAIASETDENYAGYYRQYKDAYRQLLEYSQSVTSEKSIGYR